MVKFIIVSRQPVTQWRPRIREHHHSHAWFVVTFGRRCVGVDKLIGLALTLCFVTASFTAAQHVIGAGAQPDANRCAALVELDLREIAGGPAKIISASLVDVPASGLEARKSVPSGYGNRAIYLATRIRKYCDVTGYAAPQNKFELKLPLASDWNQKLFFTACGGFCGYTDGRLLHPALARGYASVTGNGGHDSVLGFDGIWAANAPELQEDFR